MNIKTNFWNQNLDADVCPSGFIALEKFPIPITVNKVDRDRSYPIAHPFGGGYVIINDKQIPIENVVDFTIDLVAIWRDLPNSQRAIVELAGIALPSMEYATVTEGAIRCFVTGCGTVRMWQASDMIVRFPRQGERDSAMVQEQKKVLTTRPG